MRIKHTELFETDPEFVEFFENFAFDEVVKEKNATLDNETRIMTILSTLLGCQGIDEFKIMVKEALNIKISPVKIKEIIYQSVAYLGIGRVYPFIKEVNNIFKNENINLPLEGQSQTNMQDRLEKGINAQVDIFGENMKEFYKSGPEESKHINKWLAENCFGDYYTRKGLSYKERELVTFCVIAAQGGCQNQLIAHAGGNINVGNNKEFLIRVISQMVPYIGYPRSLNALAAVNEASK